MKVIVLGAGLVGNVIAQDLAENSEIQVTVVDINHEVLNELSGKIDLQTVTADLSNQEMIKVIIADHDLVIGALPGFMGYQTLKTVIGEGKNIVDISFFEEDPFSLDELAKEKGVTAVIDCGIAPGLSNIVLGYVDSLIDETESFLCYVGGLPQVREWPFEYKAPFSPSDVIEEYIRLARYIEDGEEVIKPALSESELIEFDEVGTLEAFNTDGLRTLLRTFDIPNMKEKTLRYPGHIEKMRMLRETGFFDKQLVEINGVKISPIDLTSKLLFKMWRMEPDDEDLTVMRIIIEGIKDDKKVRYSYEMLDKYDKEKEVISMARTTGYTCTAVAGLILNGIYDEKGIIPPEYLGRNTEVYHKVIEYLMERNIKFSEIKEDI
ncbi:MAG: saccharopine dehydrogenase NADP-binding domain-containing protein [Candidatus Heimdallarchaeota archaeon]|nr:saccharopine dehydrogenase [Candidatus Heimdallarchaeota archaeon]MCG3256449.1 saccharopine dehydrogenase NADP-binding domain-containing protein [Candidatus Heimdallarchaeota archaeon]MCK4611514.1 saccharopine dehydrogenase NADP-binding domain-containing protein [Candidatus Heimdallarchaeota archaeon]